MSVVLKSRSYRLGEEDKILKLFADSFGQALQKDVWSWRFQDNPAGPGIIELSWDDEVLAAHYAVTPVILSINGADYLSGLSGTTMTHPHYRGRGLFPLLAEHTYTRMNQSGFVMIWGFPNALSHRGFVRYLGWQDIHEIPVFRLLLSKMPSIPSPSPRVVELSSFDSRFDQLWDQVRSEYGVIARRDFHQLRWRYQQNPSEHYRILAYIDNQDLLGYAVFKRYRKEVQVVDILTHATLNIGMPLFFTVIQLALEESAASVGLWLNASHPLHLALEKVGFRNSEPITYFGGKLLPSDPLGTDIVDYRNWYLTMGDSDVF